MSRFMEYSDVVKRAAGGQWPYILQQLAGLDDKQVDVKWKNRGTPCPICGGTDRYSFKNPDNGGWGCRHCGGGDGWELLKGVCGWQFVDAVRAVGELLQIPATYEPVKTSKNNIEAISRAAEKRHKQAEYRQEQEARQQEYQHLQRAAYARQEWNNAVPADPSHPYLMSHQLPKFDLRQIQHPVYGNCLLVPLMNEQRELMNLERIFFIGDNPKAQKRPVKGGLKKSCFYQFGNRSFTVYIAESWSTAAAIHINKPCNPVVLAAMSAGNMEAIAGIAKRLFPEGEIVLAADNDDAGIKTAIRVAESYSLKIVLPSGEGNDFCDLHVNKSRGCRS